MIIILCTTVVIFNCPDLHCTKLQGTAIVVDFEKSTSLQCPALYGIDCTALLEFKAIV